LLFPEGLLFVPHTCESLLFVPHTGANSIWSKHVSRGNNVCLKLQSTCFLRVLL